MIDYAEREILKEAIQHYGPEAQMKMVIEEMAELQKEICKFWRGRDNMRELAEETADVEIMLDQLKMIFGLADDVKAYRQLKLERLAERVEKEG